MSKIVAQELNIRSLLSTKFLLDYYQREYRWEKKHIADLLDDLSSKFLEDHKEGNERVAVKHYDYYFLGSIIISNKEGEDYIIDGQQRLTSLTLLLICIFHKLKEQERRVPSFFENLIYSEDYGKYSYNLNVPDRKRCMESLRTGEPFNEEGETASIKNIIARYNDIKELFPDELDGEALPYFTDWLTKNVYLVQITTSSDSNSDAEAYTIFETMNDRGLSLTPTEMLKGYLLSMITDNKTREEANENWKKQIAILQDIDKGGANTIKAWLRSQYAQDIRKRDKGADPGDFDLIGSEFHRWVRLNKQNIKLSKSSDFARFIQDDFIFYGKWYKFISDAAWAKLPAEGIETICYNAHNNFTLQPPVLLAPLRKEDAKDDILRKLQIVSSYLDIMIARRFWNDKPTTYDSMKHDMFSLLCEIRGEDIGRLVDILTQRLKDMGETFDSSETTKLVIGKNKSKIRYLLARMTDYIETSSDPNCPSHYHEYIRYEVEHIWADQYKNHGHEDSNEFENEQDFYAYRNRIGGLLLLPGPKNRRYGKLPYTKKREHYIKENLLAQSLHEGAYQRAPFKDFNAEFKKNSGLEFQAHSEFKKKDLDERQELYRELCKQIWNPENLRKPLKNL